MNPLVDGGVQPPRVLPLGSQPANLPVAVRLTVLRYVLAARLIEVIVAVLVGVPMLALGLYLAAYPPDHDARRGGLLIVLGALFALGYLPVLGKRQLRDGFSVGADHTGVYLRPNLDRNRLVFVPWAGVERVRVAHWRGRQLVVKPRDTVIEQAFGIQVKGRWEERIGAEISQHRRIKRLGTNIHAPIPGVDAAELLSNMRYHAAGRAPVDMQ